MIVVIGSPIGRLADDGIVAAGPAARVALAAAAAGRNVQLLGRTGDDPAADGLLLSLAHGGVGHVALLRDPARVTPIEIEPTEDADPDPLDPAEAGKAPLDEPLSRPILDAADVELGLRYLSDFAVLVVAEPADAEVVRVVAEAASWTAAQLLLVVDAGTESTGGLPPDAIVFEAPTDDRDGVFATLLGTFAAALDDGTDPAEAFRSTIATEGWTEAADD